MGLRINTNIESQHAQIALQSTFTKLAETEHRLASGSRILRAADDASGLAVSEHIHATLRSLRQNMVNTKTALLFFQTADDAMTEINNVVGRFRELATQSASDTISDEERGYLNKEAEALKLEVDRISKATQFNGRPVLNVSGETLKVQVGPNNVDGIDRINTTDDFNLTMENLGLQNFSVLTTEQARQGLGQTDMALQTLATIRASIGAFEARLLSTSQSLSQYEENNLSAYSEIRDADIAKETARFAQAKILAQAGAAVLTQANQTPSIALKLLGA